MKFNIFKNSIIGYKNLVRGCKSQDYVDYKKEDKYIICSVADGHSTSFFKHSYEGAKFACEVSIEILSKYFNVKIENIEKYLNNYEIQKLIDLRWRELVNEHYKKYYPSVFKVEYIKYATTLLSVMITEEFILCLKLGDGEIVIKNRDMYELVINNRSNNIVDSLGRVDEYKNMMFSVLKKYDENINIVLFTDGYFNAFENKIKLFESLEKTIQNYNSSVFSRFNLYKNYPNYLNNISKNITYDDISIVFII